MDLLVTTLKSVGVVKVHKDRPDSPLVPHKHVFQSQVEVYDVIGVKVADTFTDLSEDVLEEVGVLVEAVRGQELDQVVGVVLHGEVEVFVLAEVVVILDDVVVLGVFE